MNNNRLGSHIVLALAVAAIAIVANATLTVQNIDEFDLTGSTRVFFIASWFTQASTAMAMVCAVLLARGMTTANARALAVERDDSDVRPVDEADEQL